MFSEWFSSMVVSMHLICRCPDHICGIILTNWCSLAHLVGFALKLRNLGVSDHGLIRELSAPLAGSLYTGEGHSRLYDDGKVYE